MSMNKSPLRIVLCSFVFMFLLNPFTAFCDDNEWSEWIALDDGQKKGLDFCWRNEESDRGSVLLWRWNNRYTKAVKVKYKIKYVSGRATKVLERELVLEPGINDSPSFRIPGTALSSVQVGILQALRPKNPNAPVYTAEMEMQEKAEREQSQRLAIQRERARKQLEAEQRERDFRLAEENRKLEAERRREEARQQREEEAERRREEEAREERREREEERQADERHRQQMAESQRQSWNNTMQIIQNSTNQTLQTLENNRRMIEQAQASKRTGGTQQSSGYSPSTIVSNQLAQQRAQEEQQRQLREQQEQQRKREQQEKEQQEKERQEQLERDKRDREAREQDQQRTQIASQQATKKASAGCTSMTKSVYAEVRFQKGLGHFCTGPEMNAFLTNNSSSDVTCELVPVKGGSFNTGGMQIDLAAGQKKGGEDFGMFWCGYEKGDDFKYACVLKSDPGSCKADMVRRAAGK